ncbi:hypothetical protein LCGC14_2066980 [marine sediment metagenome]|uniref:Phytase-like domain-containing protein n=1 Tax=marine sediment metagenome TaxID=412755 RepID=A0A0F9GY15_9ZZZZ
MITSLIALIFGAAIGAEAPQARFVGNYAWTGDDARLGGLSGIEVTADGSGIVAISDRGWLIQGALSRSNGAVSGVTINSFTRLQDLKGEPVSKRFSDAEGLALGDDGTLFVSFEAQHRVWSYPEPGGPAKWMSRHPDFEDMQNNSSLEALAVGPDGAVYTMPERSGRLDRPFPVYRFQNGSWDQPFSIPRRGEHLAVGADFGPDGKFYLLERHFTGIFGFSTRIRRFTLGPDGFTDEEVLLKTWTGRHDNLEGISAWRGPNGEVRLTLVSDDNFHLLQRTELVDYVIDE